MHDVRYRYKSFSGIAMISMTWKFWGMGSLRDRVSEGTESLTWSRQLSTFYTVVSDIFAVCTTYGSHRPLIV